MISIQVLENSIQTYAWGSHTAIAALLGDPGPSETPQAELWMGAHPKAPSMIQINNRSRSLLDLIEKYPVQILGQQTARRYGNQLPYLFKVWPPMRPFRFRRTPMPIKQQPGAPGKMKWGYPPMRPTEITRMIAINPNASAP